MHTLYPQDFASVSERDETWTLRKVGVLHSLALALARGGDHAMAENKLLDAIAQLQTLDGVKSAEAGSCAHQVNYACRFSQIARTESRTESHRAGCGYHTKHAEVFWQYILLQQC